MRELVTIGATFGPNARSGMRRANYLRLATGMGGIGQTKLDFAPGATSSSAGAALSQAGVDLLDYLDANGVPSEHVADQHVEEFQLTWNEDPANAAATAQLNTDGEYGANTHDALLAIVGAVAPAVNTGATPAPNVPGGTTPATPAVAPPTPLATAGVGGGGGSLLLLAGAALVVGYLLFGRKKGARASVTIHRNPRRGRGRGRRAYL